MSDGQTRISTRDYWDQDLKIRSWDLVWPKDWSYKKLVYNQNSQTLPSERAWESCWRKTVKRSPPSFHGMVVSTIWLKTIKSWWPVSVKRVDLKVIFRVLDSKSLPLKESPCWPFSQAKKKRNDPNASFI